MTQPKHYSGLRYTTLIAIDQDTEEVVTEGVFGQVYRLFMKELRAITSQPCELLHREEVARTRPKTLARWDAKRRKES